MTPRRMRLLNSPETNGCGPPTCDDEPICSEDGAGPGGNGGRGKLAVAGMPYGGTGDTEKELGRNGSGAAAALPPCPWN
jgi:hypothetical protein